MTCDNSLWGTVKDNIFNLHVTTVEDLKQLSRMGLMTSVSIVDIQKNMGDNKN